MGDDIFVQCNKMKKKKEKKLAISLFVFLVTTLNSIVYMNLGFFNRTQEEIVSFHFTKQSKTTKHTNVKQ